MRAFLWGYAAGVLATFGILVAYGARVKRADARGVVRATEPVRVYWNGRSYEAE